MSARFLWRVQDLFGSVTFRQNLKLNVNVELMKHRTDGGFHQFVLRKLYDVPTFLKLNGMLVASDSFPTLIFRTGLVIKHLGCKAFPPKKIF